MTAQLHNKWYAVAFFAALTLGCEPSVGPRALPFPSFDPVQPFPELSQPASEAQDTSGAQAGERDDFESAIRKARSGQDPDAVAPARTRNVQTVPLATILTADVPMEFDEWQYATDGISTLITHQPPGSLPDALIYVEALSPAIDAFPSYEIGRFQFTVDPGLSPNIVYPPLAALGWEWAQAQTFPPFDVLLSLQMATTRTAGMGLGYRSADGSFMGWKWVGTNDAELEVRLGRTSGRWDAPAYPGQLQVEAILRDLVTQLPVVQRILDQITETRVAARRAQRPTTSAWMILGTATRRDNRAMGVHIAIVCARKPVCPVSEELSTFLATLRPMQKDMQVAAPTESLKTFAQDIGVGLLSPDDLIAPDQMITLLRRRLATKGQGGTQFPTLPDPTQLDPSGSIPIPDPTGGNPDPTAPIPIPPKANTQ